MGNAYAGIAEFADESPIGLQNFKLAICEPTLDHISDRLARRGIRGKVHSNARSHPKPFRRFFIDRHDVGDAERLDEGLRGNRVSRTRVGGKLGSLEDVSPVSHPIVDVSHEREAFPQRERL